jgi:hypothetical protein
MVRDERTVLVGAKRQGQAVETLRRAVPSKTIGESLARGHELGLQLSTHDRVGAIGAHHQLGIGQIA